MVEVALLTEIQKSAPALKPERKIEHDNCQMRGPEPASGGFILKVSPKNNGSQHLVMGAEEMSPGDEIPRHKHLGRDEIVFLQTGTLHARLGGQERDLHAGGMALIPAYTWPALLLCKSCIPRFEVIGERAVIR
jgi:quercetin dioxygenase-like cupin family protein